jgi:hypothetical protein
MSNSSRVITYCNWKTLIFFRNKSIKQIAVIKINFKNYISNNYCYCNFILFDSFIYLVCFLSILFIIFFCKLNHPFLYNTANQFWHFAYHTNTYILDNKIKEFNWKLAKNDFLTSYTLKLFRLRVSDICTICNTSADAVQHLSWKCPNLMPFVNTVFNKLTLMWTWMKSLYIHPTF